MIIETNKKGGNPAYNFYAHAEKCLEIYKPYIQAPSLEELLNMDEVEQEKLRENTFYWMKIFNPTWSWTWYLCEYEPETKRAFGFVRWFDDEFWYFNLEELSNFRGHFGLPLEIDLHFQPKTRAELKKDLSIE